MSEMTESERRARLAELSAQKAALEAEIAALSGGAAISPLAPAAFPELPTVAGATMAAAAGGVRYRGRADVMLARLAPGSVIAGTFTRSATRAAPVLLCEERLATHAAAPDGGALGIVVNAGNANAFTGNHGMEATRRVTDATADALGCPVGNVFMASTGVIGEPLPAERITAVLADLAARQSEDALEAAAGAIMTTDTFPKGAGCEIEIGGARVRVAGIAKGSGMIAPDMATMLVFIFTDCAIAQPLLQAAVARLTDLTFNAITVDGDTSTSDTLLVGATGRAAMEPIATPEDPRLPAFEGALETVMRELALLVVRDGEGATKLVEIAVTGAESDAAARRVGLSIANSPLVKTAIAGEDPNWGRVVMAVGKSGERADRDRLAIRFGTVLVAEKGWRADSYDEAAVAAYMKGEALEIGVDLGIGTGRASVWTCDLTKRYIEINADYRS